MIQKDQEIVNLLWTGGWDSTFRLLQLLLVLKKNVQPYYVIDSDRLSTRMELWTMKEIRRKIIMEYPEVKDLLLPTKLKEIHEIIPNEKITHSFSKLIEEKYIGDQYEWLARFAEQEQIGHLELSIVKSDDGPSFLIEEYLKLLMVNGVSTYEVDQIYETINVYSVFKYFSFSIFYLNKVKMHKIANAYKFLHILNNSWFCHKPMKNGKPCGVCKPCTVIMKTGMQYRMPGLSQFRYHIRFLINFKQFKLKFPGLYNKLKLIKNSGTLGKTYA